MSKMESQIDRNAYVSSCAILCTCIFTDMAVISVTKDGFLQETAPGVSVEEVKFH